MLIVGGQDIVGLDHHREGVLLGSTSLGVIVGEEAEDNQN